MVKRRNLHAILLLAELACIPANARATSKIETGDATPLKASAHLDFTIVIPNIVFLQVGTGATATDNATVDSLVFTVPPDHVSDATAVAPDAVPAGNGRITARVTGNNGAITLSSSTSGAMTNAAGDTISYAQMRVAVASHTTAAPLAHPVLVDGSATSLNLPTTRGNITQFDAQWNFTYANQSIIPAGIYGGNGKGNGRVTYSVSVP